MEFLPQGARLMGWLFLLTLFAVCLAIVPSAAADTAIIRNGKSNAVIVTADTPTAVVRYAAEELALHIDKATGVKLAIVTESAVPASANYRFYLGETRAAQTVGINTASLAPETFVLRTVGNILFIAGNDDTGDPLDIKTSAGTLFGVYEWLERSLKVRWLWPGELGTFVPKTSLMAATSFHETVSPRLFQRNVRTGLNFPSEHPALGFTPGAAQKYAQEQTVFLRRHRMGRGKPISYGHAFTDWWEKYGKEHPGWFQLVNGKRGPVKPGGSYSMCVSNPEFQQKVVDLWREEAKTAGSGSHYLNAVENGIIGFCECENCRALDGPEPPDYLTYYSPKHKMIGTRFATDRYAKYWLAVQREAAKTDPNVVVVAYAYFNYFHYPSPSIKLNKNILVGSYPSSGWFPRAPDENEWFKKQWKGWADTGATLFSRTNYFLDGYCMPFIFAHQFADDFQSAVKNGMAATDYDSLTGQWATQGPTLYLLMRLQTHPNANPDTLLNEYYSGFGPAAAQVKAYFDYWEKYTRENRASTNKIFDDLDAARWRTWAKAAHKVFPESCFAPGEALLTKAAIAAAGDKEALARVAFLQTGLTHAKLCSRTAALLTLADPTATPERGQKALDDLLAFRRAHEREGFANLGHESWVEDLSWKLPDTAKQRADR
jgi:hypothetical protein